MAFSVLQGFWDNSPVNSNVHNSEPNSRLDLLNRQLVDVINDLDLIARNQKRKSNP